MDGSIRVLYLGRRHPLKGVEFLERAVRELGEVGVSPERSELRSRRYAGCRSRTVDGELEFVIVNGEEAPFRKTKNAQTETSNAYAYRVNEIEVVPRTLGGRITPTTYPTDTTSICGDILLYGVKNVNGESLGEGNLGEARSRTVEGEVGVGSRPRRTVELRIVSDHFGEELERDWNWCDVLVLPTLSENFGLVVAEALERGKRVITTDGAPAWRAMAAAKEEGERRKEEEWRERLIYLEGFRDGTDEERVRLLKGALRGG